MPAVPRKLRPLCALLVLSIPFLPGCEEEQTTRSSTPAYDLELPTKAPEGPIFEDEDFVLEVGTPQFCSAEGVLGPEEGLQRISIPVEVRHRGKRDLPWGPLLFSIQSDGQTYRPTLASCTSPFKTRTLNDDTKQKDHLTFDVAWPLDRPVIVFEPFVVGRKKIEARALVPAPLKQPAQAP